MKATRLLQRQSPVVSVWFMMLQCFAKYSVSRVLQSSPIIDPSKEVSRSQTLRAKLELMKYSRQNLIPYGACVCGYAAKKNKIKSTGSSLDNMLQI